MFTIHVPPNKSAISTTAFVSTSMNPAPRKNARSIAAESGRAAPSRPVPRESSRKFDSLDGAEGASAFFPPYTIHSPTDRISVSAMLRPVRPGICGWKV